MTKLTKEKFLIEHSMIKPRSLKKGDTVSIISLSSGILGDKEIKHQLNLGIERLENFGLKVKFSPNSLKGSEYLRLNPDARAEDLKIAFLDKNIKAIICAIGGQDTYKTIPFLMHDLEFKKIVKENPKIFIGFSDSTNNHILLNNLGLVTYYGLSFLSDFCELSTHMLQYTEKSFKRFFRNDSVYKMTSSKFWYLNRKDYSDIMIGVPLVKYEEKRGYEVLHGKGKVKGIFFGGCLESIYDIYSSERYPDQRKKYSKYDILPNKEFFINKIFFIETSEEIMEPSKFNRVIWFLYRQNVFKNIKALIVGKPYDEIYYNEYKEILTRFGKITNIPILYNINFGHSLPRNFIPYGVAGEIDFDLLTIRVIEKMFSD